MVKGGPESQHPSSDDPCNTYRMTKRAPPTHVNCSYAFMFPITIRLWPRFQGPRKAEHAPYLCTRNTDCHPLLFAVTVQMVVVASLIIVIRANPDRWKGVLPLLASMRRLEDIGRCGHAVEVLLRAGTGHARTVLRQGRGTPTWTSPIPAPTPAVSRHCQRLASNRR